MYLNVSGDAYRFTLQPVFPNPKQEFRCHIRHVAPDVLYQMWFYLTIPGTSFETPRIYATVRAGDVVGKVSAGRYQLQFLTIEHSTGIDLLDDFIVIGRDAGGGRWNHTVHPLRSKATDSTSRRVQTHAISNNIFVMTAQFGEPFGHSTSTWVAGNGSCDKDVSKFRPVQKLPAHGPSQRVAAVVTAGDRAPYEYQLKSPQNPPLMKFIIPGEYFSS